MQHLEIETGKIVKHVSFVGKELAEDSRFCHHPWESIAVINILILRNM